MILEYMDEANQAISNQTCHSSNMAGLSTGKMEREIARILATKFHTEPVIDP
jgi:flagellar basal body rod protein FlgF